MSLVPADLWQFIFYCGLTLVGPLLVLIFVDYFTDLKNPHYDMFEGVARLWTFKSFIGSVAITFYIHWLLVLCIAVLFDLSGLQIIYLWVLLILGLIDFKVRFLPDLLTLSLLWLGLIMSVTSFGIVSAASAVWGAVVAYTATRLMNYLFFLWRKRDGLGRGDMKLLAAIAAWSGLFAILPIIFIASVLALIMGLGVILWKKNSTVSLPFGPFLAMAALVYLLLVHSAS